MAYVPMGCKDPVAYCRHHKKGLSVRQMKKKGCLSKRCRHLSRNAHPFWVQRASKKQMARERREELARMADGAGAERNGGDHGGKCG